jgi:hypothetical protein
MRNATCRSKPLAFRPLSHWNDPCCGSFHPVSLHITTLVTIILAVVLLVAF